VLKLEKGNRAFSVGGSWRDRALLIGWITETQFKNINHYFIIFFRLGPPFFTVTSEFVIDS
jgi:hypothetical protein